MKKKIVLLLAMLMILATPVGSFAKDTELSKAEFLKAVLVAAEVEVQEDIESELADSIDAEYIPYIEAAYNKNIISEDERLNLDKSITKQEAVVILVKVFGERVQVKNITEEMIEAEMDFSDNASINPLAKPYITYAIKNDMIKSSKRAFYPLMLIDEEESEELIEKAKEAHEEYFTREGLSAGEMMVLVDKNLQELETYKATGSMDMNISMKVEGLPAEDDFEQQILDNGINMEMSYEFDMQIENPYNVYMKQSVKSNINGLEIEENSEVFMDELAMYQKTAFSEEQWIKNDMGLRLREMQSLQGNNPQNMSQLSGEQLEFFKDYTWYGDNEEVDGKEYYVINVDIDKETYKKFSEEYTKKIMAAYFEQQEELSSLQGMDEAEIEMMKAIIEEVIDKMEIEMSCKYYIDKKTMNYKKVDVIQNTYISVDSFMEMFADMAEEEDVDLSNVKIGMVNHSVGTFDYYDFDGEVDFPEITEEDILDLENLMMPQN